MGPEDNTEIEITTQGHGAEIAAVFFASLACAVIAYGFGIKNNQQSSKPVAASIEIDVAKSGTTISIDPFATIQIQAKAAYVYDVAHQKVLYEKNADVTLPLASITKIMTANVAVESLAKDATISIQPSALAQDGDSGLLTGEKWNFTKLLDYTLAVSSNDGAAAVAEAVGPNFVDLMNQKTALLNLSSMHFYNETGLDVSPAQSGGYGSAADVTRLFKYTLDTHPEIFTPTTYQRFTVSSLDNVKHIAINTDADLDKIPGIIGSKTGFTDLAGGNLVVVYDASLNYPIIVVVLGSTYDGRFSDMTDLINAAQQTLLLQK